MSTLDHTLEPEAAVVRRLEVISGTGRRRRFSDDDKTRMIEETLAPGAVVSEVARRHGLTPQQLFTWRRQARQPVGAAAVSEASAFVPAVIEAPPPERPARWRARKQARAIVRAAGAIEVEIDGVRVRVGRGAEARTVMAVIRALKAGV